MKQYVLGIDHGTGGCKVTCLDSDGQRVSEAYVSYPSHYEHQRWVEQDPEDWIDAAVEGVNKTLAHFSADQRSRIAAIGFSAPHHVAVLLDRDLQVIRRAIMWNDQRSSEESKYLADNYGELIYRITNNKPATTWTLSQMLWLLKHEPRMYERIHRIVFMKDYVRYRFSGELATDYIDAEGTLFFDIHKREWSAELLRLIELETDKLPAVKIPTELLGELKPEMAERIGLRSGIPIVVGTADTAAEVFGSGAVDEGDGLAKLATAGNYAFVSSRLPVNPNLIVYEHAVDGLYYINSATNFAASSFRWFKEAFYPEAEKQIPQDQIYPYINEEIAATSPGSEGLLFHPYLNGERSPYWDPYLRASFFGVTARHQRAHFARAVMEGVAFSLRDAGDEFGERASKPLKLIGGGSKSRIWTQIMADILDREMEIPLVSEASFGNCLVTATAIGWYADVKEAVKNCQSIVSKVAPNPEHVSIYNELFGIYKDLQKTTQPLSHRITKLMERVKQP